MFTGIVTCKGTLAAKAFYGGDSLLLFEDGQPTERRRFEPTERIAVQRD